MSSYTESTLEEMSKVIVTSITARDVRFHTSQDSSGSDAVSPDPEYSCTYVTIQVDRDGVPAPDLTGTAIAFSIGRGNEIIKQLVDVIGTKVVGLKLSQWVTNFAAVWRRITVDGQLKWIGPDKGPAHQASSPLVNALWDVWAKYEKKPVWELVVDLSPEHLLTCLDFRYVRDVLDEEEALALLKKCAVGKERRKEDAKQRGYPSYTTSTGWLGYSDDKVRKLCKESLDAGMDAFKMKVGVSLEDDAKRAALMRECIGWDCKLMMDANAIWGVREAIDNMTSLSQFNPYWIEEPTCPDDVLGHATIQKALDPFAINVRVFVVVELLYVVVVVH